MNSSLNRFAQDLFAPLAGDYERWSRLLSFGQDPLWRRSMVEGLGLAPGSRVLDVAAGTGEVTRLLSARGFRVASLDQSREMLSQAAARGATAVLGRAEALPFPDGAFDGLTFTYLLRYVEDPAACLRELARVVRPGGVVGMVEFGRPKGFWDPLWRFYVGCCLPAAGTLIAPGWKRVGSFLGPSIDAFHRRFPAGELARLWEGAGLTDLRAAHPSVGGGLVIWGKKG
jgi:demethylmenaquinone methyltransferase / 2-methoxy-6-polyprenyl-1,4-benzoquinol methylase